MFRSDYDGSTKVGDGKTGVFESPPFRLGPGKIEWMYAGAGGTIALVDATASSSAVLLSFAANRQSTTLTPASWTAAQLKQYIDKSVKLQIADTATGGWGHIAVDNLKYFENKAGEPGEAHLLVSACRVPVGRCSV